MEISNSVEMSNSLEMSNSVEMSKNKRKVTFDISTADNEKYSNYLKERQEKLNTTKTIENNLCLYTESIRSYLEEYDLSSFWITIPDEINDFDSIEKLSAIIKDSEKFNYNRNEMQIHIDKDPSKFKNKKLALFMTDPYKRSKFITRDLYYRNRDTWISSKVIIHKLSDEPNINLAKFSGIHCIWLSTDFNVSRFSLELMIAIAIMYSKNDLNCWSICGSPFVNILELMVKKCVIDTQYIQFIKSLLTPLDLINY